LQISLSSAKEQTGDIRWRRERKLKLRKLEDFSKQRKYIRNRDNKQKTIYSQDSPCAYTRRPPGRLWCYYNGYRLQDQARMTEHRIAVQRAGKPKELSRKTMRRKIEVKA
jgi:hypothetical protein